MQWRVWHFLIRDGFAFSCSHYLEESNSSQFLLLFPSVFGGSLFAQKERGCWQKNVKSCKQEAVCWHCTDPQNIQHNGKREGSLHAACVLQRLSCCCHPLIILILCLGLLFQNICSLMETFKCLDSTQLSLSRAIRCQIVFLYWNLWENCFDK